MQYFLCNHTTGCVRHTLLRQMGMGSLTCAQIWVQVEHTKGGHARTSLHKSWLGETQKTVPQPAPPQGIEPWVFGFEFRRSNHRAAFSVVISYSGICNTMQGSTAHSFYRLEHFLEVASRRVHRKFLVWNNEMQRCSKPSWCSLMRNTLILCLHVSWSSFCPARGSHCVSVIMFLTLWERDKTNRKSAHFKYDN